LGKDVLTVENPQKLGGAKGIRDTANQTAPPATMLMYEISF